MATLLKSLSGRVPDYYQQKEKAEKKLGRKLTNREFESEYLILPDNASSLPNTGTSTFDPVLAELMYLWFSKVGDAVIDPFAGGSVRGIIAETLDRHYTGIDIRQEQIDANYDNAHDFILNAMPRWICGDSINIQDLAPGEYDFLLTCPPYGDLEVYSDIDGDISNKPAEEFDVIYTQIMQYAAAMLREDRFSCVVVGNYRDKNGFMRDLCGLTIRAMEAAGCRFYNDMILITTLGSWQTRVGNMFQKSRKVGKTHQNVLIFCKGDPKRATYRLGDVEIPDMKEYEKSEEDLELF